MHAQTHGKKLLFFMTSFEKTSKSMILPEKQNPTPERKEKKKEKDNNKVK